MNRCPTEILKKNVPQEAWTGMNPSLCHLNFFGCVAYYHVPYELRKKLDNKGQKCIFDAYSEDTKSYNLYDSFARKVIISRDVQFVENESWDGTIDTNVKIVSNVDNDDMAVEVVLTPNVSQPIVARSNSITP